MTPVTIQAYAAELRRTLGASLCSEYTDEIVSETANHLTERSDELMSTGLSRDAAERRAVDEFGDVHEIATAMAKEYPPKTPLDPARLRWLPELGIAIELALAAYVYSLYGGARGIETAAQCVIPMTPMLLIPGLTAGLARLKYRRLRALAVHTRMATYAILACIIGTACLTTLQIIGRATLTSIYPLMYAFAAVSLLFYGAMRMAFSDSKPFVYLARRFRTR